MISLGSLISVALPEGSSLKAFLQTAIRARAAGQVGVVEVEHVPGGPGGQHALEQPVAGRFGGARAAGSSRPALAHASQSRKAVR